MDINETRPNEFKTVSSWLDPNTHKGNVNIYGISGYGGIGKSYLLKQAIDSVKPETNGFLKIQIDGSNKSILGNFMALYGQQFAPVTISQGKAGYDYFPRSRKLTQKYTEISKTIEDKIENSSEAESFKKIAKGILQGGSFLNKTAPKTKDYINFEVLDEMEKATDFLNSLVKVSKSSWLPGPIKDIFGIRYRERIFDDLDRLSAEELTNDLSAIFNQYQGNQFTTLTHSPIKGLDHLLLIFDDFEILGKTITDFITTALIPSLINSKFKSTIIILGRDKLSDADEIFNHHLSVLIRSTIRLERFSKKIAEQMFRNAGHPKKDLPTLIEESQLTPFLVTLLCEAKGGSVSFYQQFYERTTRWLKPEEKNWVLPLCYLDKITEASIPEMITDTPASNIIEWFEKEASLRDPNAEWYTIAPYIRRTLKEYHHKKIGSKKYSELVEKGRKASKNA